MFAAGDILEISYKHPVIGSGVLFPKAGEDGTFDPGGFRSNDDANMVAAAGQNIRQINRVKWSFESTVAWDMAVQDEVAQMARLSAHPVDADWTFTHINGTIWGGKGSPVGDIQGNTNTGQMSIKLSGGGELKKIS